MFRYSPGVAQLEPKESCHACAHAYSERNLKTVVTCSGSSTDAAGGDGGNVTERMPPQLPHCTATVFSCRPPPQHGTPTCTYTRRVCVIVRALPSFDFQSTRAIEVTDVTSRMVAQKLHCTQPSRSGRRPPKQGWRAADAMVGRPSSVVVGAWRGSCGH
jgi:hypothetical protein